MELITRLDDERLKLTEPYGTYGVNHDHTRAANFARLLADSLRAAIEEVDILRMEATDWSESWKKAEEENDQLMKENERLRKVIEWAIFVCKETADHLTDKPETYKDQKSAFLLLATKLQYYTEGGK